WRSLGHHATAFHCRTFRTEKAEQGTRKLTDIKIIVPVIVKMIECCSQAGEGRIYPPHQITFLVQNCF
ncbi:MAG: hypothetical protein LBU51_09945, partial [Bacteroidales bacterium]|nr:hypothetical protein [Bacteroidales bacterium]